MKACDKRILIIAITILIVLFASGLTLAFGSSGDSTAKTSLTEISKVKMDSYYLTLYRYCQHESNEVIGFQAISNVESVPVLTSPRVGECQTYGAKIHTDETGFVKSKLLTKSDLPVLIKNYENKKKSLENELLSKQQQLTMYYKTNASDEKISKQINAIEYLKELLKSAKTSIAILKSA